MGIRNNYVPKEIDRNALIDDLISMVDNLDCDGKSKDLQYLRINLEAIREGDLGLGLGDAVANTIARHWL